jgi:hypothetical protein
MVVCTPNVSTEWVEVDGDDDRVPVTVTMIHIDPVFRLTNLAL